MTGFRELVPSLGLLGLLVSAVPAVAYTGGPLRVEVTGFDVRDERVHYRAFSQDESGSAPQCFYFDLRGARPGQAVRARSLEVPESLAWRGDPGEAWRKLVARLEPLPADSNLDLRLRMTSQPLSGMGPDRPPRRALHVEIESGDLRATADLEAWCRPLVRVQGLYAIPGRRERIVVLTYVGRWYWCEEVDLPLVMR